MSLKAIQKMYNEHDTGMIATISQHKILKAKLLAFGYGVIPIKGDKDISESSFFVVDIYDKKSLKDDLIKLGTEYNQGVITFAENNSDYYAISINGENIGKYEELGTPQFGENGIDGFSKITHRAFVFESATLDKMANRTINERNSVLAMAGMLKR
jgi:hypothetical protein